MAEKAQSPKDLSKHFEVGDLAVYPAHGVGRIESIESRVINGDTHDFYIMKIIDNGMVIMIPTSNVDSVGLRTVVDKTQIPDIYAVLTEKKDDLQDNQTWNRRYKEYMDKLKTGSPFDVAAVFRDLYMLKLSKDLSFGERKLLDTARTLLMREICTAKNQEESQVRTEIESLFDNNGNGSKPAE
ncbi:CarD family transcriptional regulator [Desulfosalsimonas propionicica]|uniref:CarD family transcriptional regulator n=1 Tax=Desulfosalsimonas propionicica TaxID=332175 RepID=A0A7W0HKJ9_9BACT|nr:CarD family transcriptional regulator [Desulfosalsimonas propionicica]MBA2881151.1 CarD family transcriptional regulator [Desulfosalsimonas propionicica]